MAVARRGERVELSDAALQRMAASREIVERLVQGDPAYGVSTGSGALANTTIPLNRRVALQRAPIRSHAAGMGEEVEPEVVRAMMFLRARTSALGASGTRTLGAADYLAVSLAERRSAVERPIQAYGPTVLNAK